MSVGRERLSLQRHTIVTVSCHCVHAAPRAVPQVEKSKEAIDACKETLSTHESKYSKLQATQEMMREQEGERSKLANSIADTYAMDKGLVVSVFPPGFPAACALAACRCEHSAFFFLPAFEHVAAPRAVPALGGW